MWLLDRFHSWRSRKAFRVIAKTMAPKPLAALSLHYPTMRAMNCIKCTHTNRIIEKTTKEITKLQPLHFQPIHMTTNLYTSIVKQSHTIAKHPQQVQAQLRKQVYLIQKQSFREEQAYFKSRPTLAKQLYRGMLLGQHQAHGDLHIRPMHLDILQKSVPIAKATPEKVVQLPSLSTPHSSVISQAMLREIMREVQKQLQRERFRGGS